MTDTYEEPIGRYRIMYQDELPPEHQAAYRLRGLDPKEMWSLKWSFEDREAAEKMLADEEARAPAWRTYRMADAGPDAPKTITRSAWF